MTVSLIRWRILETYFNYFPCTISVSLNYFFTANELPKSVLFTYALKHCWRIPEYETEQNKKLFRSTVRMNGKPYSSGYWEKNKKFAEQGAALAAMLAVGLVDRESLIRNGSLIE